MLEAYQTAEKAIPAGDMLVQYPDLKQPTQTIGESKLAEQFMVGFTMHSQLSQNSHGNVYEQESTRVLGKNKALFETSKSRK